MSVSQKPKPRARDVENILQHGALTLEFVSHNDRNEVTSLQKKKVQELLTQMYIRAKKRGRPKSEEEEMENAA